MSFVGSRCQGTTDTGNLKHFSAEFLGITCSAGRGLA
jgi:hypothetical protein